MIQTQSVFDDPSRVIRKASCDALDFSAELDRSKESRVDHEPALVEAPDAIS